MAGKLMTQAEMMAWEKKARRWVIGGLTVVITAVFGAGWLTLDLSYRMLKQTPVMTEAFQRLASDARVAGVLGQPLRTGWAVTGELEDLPERGQAQFEFTVKGPKGLGRVKLRAEKSPTGTWRYFLLEMTPLSGGEVVSCADR